MVKKKENVDKPAAQQASFPTACPNCRQTDTPITRESESPFYLCPVCGYTWTEDEAGQAQAVATVESGETSPNTGEAVAEPEAPFLPGSCINCGQEGEAPIDVRKGHNADVFYCPKCGHEWTLEHEQAPFRRLRRQV